MATDDFRVSRRRFLRDAAIGAGAFAIAGRSAFGAFSQGAASALPPPAQSGIEHIVVMMMENRSFDHFLGWLPGAQGRQAGPKLLDDAGPAHATPPPAPDYPGCWHPESEHSDGRG